MANSPWNKKKKALNKQSPLKKTKMHPGSSALPGRVANRKAVPCCAQQQNVSKLCGGGANIKSELISMRIDLRQASLCRVILLTEL